MLSTADLSSHPPTPPRFNIYSFSSLVSSPSFGFSSLVAPISLPSVGRDGFGVICLQISNKKGIEMEQNHPEAPSPCVNNCGFFGSASTMNMCSKCHRDSLLNQQQAKLAESSIASIRNGSSSNTSLVPLAVNPSSADAITLITQTVATPSLDMSAEEKPKETSTRCSTCRKRVGLTGFNCRCGNYFCAVHRYSDKHSCAYDYRTAGRDAIAKANPTIKADKLDKI